MNTNTIKRNISSEKGFTIVETLIAIAVLMIAIAGPLVIASKGLTAALYSKDQMIASFLAQESMEVIKNLRDNSYDANNSSAWLDNLGSVNCEGNGKRCDADPLNSQMLNTSFVSGDGHSLYLDFSNGYTSQNGGGEDTKFKRYFYIEKVDNSDGSGNKDENQRRVHVVVTWQAGTVPFETEIVELITNAKR